jgi:hypothetical protein
MIDSGVPDITQPQLSIELVDSKALGSPGPGGGAFQQAIQCLNASDPGGGVAAFETALRQGLDPLRQGYARANLGELKLKQGDLGGAVEHLIGVLDSGQALYESVHLAVQYLAVILTELGRLQEAGRLQGLASRTSAHLGYSLSPAAAERVRQLVRRSQG